MASKCASASRPLLRQSCPRVALRKLNLPVTPRKLSHLRVACLRRIRRFFFAAASVACPLRKIRRLSPRIRRLSASPKNRDCPTPSHRRIRCYHPFPVAAASVARPRHPIRSCSLILATAFVCRRYRQLLADLSFRSIGGARLLRQPLLHYPIRFG